MYDLKKSKQEIIDAAKEVNLEKRITEEQKSEIILSKVRDHYLDNIEEYARQIFDCSYEILKAANGDFHAITVKFDTSKIVLDNDEVVTSKIEKECREEIFTGDIILHVWYPGINDIEESDVKDTERKILDKLSENFANSRVSRHWFGKPIMIIDLD